MKYFIDDMDESPEDDRRAAEDKADEDRAVKIAYAVLGIIFGGLFILMECLK